MPNMSSVITSSVHLDEFYIAYHDEKYQLMFSRPGHTTTVIVDGPMLLEIVQKALKEYNAQLKTEVTKIVKEFAEAKASGE